MQLYHLTINSGHVRRSPDKEFEATVPIVQGWLQTAKPRTVPGMRGEPLVFNLGDVLADYFVVLGGVLMKDDYLVLEVPGVVSFSLHKEEALLVHGMLCWEPENSLIAWDLCMEFHHVFENAATTWRSTFPPLSCPTETPWLAVTIFPFSEASEPWVGGFEANLAFALIREYGGSKARQNSGGSFGIGSTRNANILRRGR